MKKITGEVLEQMIDDISDDESSDNWVRQGMTTDSVSNESVKKILKKRFGPNTLVADPQDPHSIDKAISNDYNVIRGGHFNKDEWRKVKEAGALSTTSSVFGTSFTGYEEAKPTPEQCRFRDFVKKLAYDAMAVRLTVSFIKSPKASTVADYIRRDEHSASLRFNLSHMRGADYWGLVNGKPTRKMLDLIIHELGHQGGTHYQSGYHDMLTYLGSWCVKQALESKTYFNI